MDIELDVSCIDEEGIIWAEIILSNVIQDPLMENINWLWSMDHELFNYFGTLNMMIVEWKML